MRFSGNCLAIAGLCLTTLAFEQQPLAPGVDIYDKSGNPWTDPQAGIRYLNRDINDLIKNFAQNNISEAIWDYIPLRVFIASSLWGNIFSEGTTCSGTKIGPYPNTTDEVIQTLQRTQLGFNVVSQDLINKANEATLKQDFCAGAMNLFWSVSCFEGGGFAKTLNGTFESPARWICKQYRYVPPSSL